MTLSGSTILSRISKYSGLFSKTGSIECKISVAAYKNSGWFGSLLIIESTTYAIYFFTWLLFILV